MDTKDEDKDGMITDVEPSIKLKLDFTHLL
jgi:hypothetical protein